MILNSSCVHYWIIREISIGRCEKCGAIRDFEQLGQELRQEKKAIMNIHRMTVHKRKK